MDVYVYVHVHYLHVNAYVYVCCMHMCRYVCMNMYKVSHALKVGVCVCV